MKETYYKLNREKLARRAYWLTILQDEGILEEVQEEEEMTLEEQEENLYKLAILHDSFKGKSPLMTATEKAIDHAKSKEELPKMTAAERNTSDCYGYIASENGVKEMKLQEESKQAIDNMFGNPLGQIDNMIEGTKVEEESQGMSIKSKYLLGDEPAPYTEGVTLDELSAHIEELRKAGQLPDQLADAAEPKPFLDGMTPSEWIFDKHPYGEHSPTIEMRNTKRFLDLLVEELKRNNLIK